MLGAYKKMGSINFNSLKNVNYSQKNYVYTDLFLDLTQEPHEIGINTRGTNSQGRDIKIAYNINAIKNSIVNLFNTSPGERLLLPDYGCNLKGFIFDSITESTANEIGRTISRSLQMWEPRVNLVDMDITGYESRHEYVVTLILEVPFFDENNNDRFSIVGVLNNEGFIA